MTARDRWLALALFALGALVLAPGAFWGLPSSKGVVGALRVMAGDVPYRDFWTMYAPGQFYAIAGLYRLFGSELVVQGLAVVALRAASAALLFLLARRLGAPRAGALAVGVLFVGLSWEIAPELESYSPALFFLLLALHGIALHAERGRSFPLLAAGLALGCAAVFKHDVAAYLAVAAAAGLAFGPRLAERGSGPAARPLEAVATLAVGTLIVVLPAIVWLAIAAGQDAWTDLIVFPATDFRAIRSEPYPGLLPNLAPWRSWLETPASPAAASAALGSSSRWLLGNLPQVAFVLGLAFALARRGRLPRPRATFTLVALTGLPLYWWAAHTQPNTHLTSMAVMACLLGSAAWPHFKGRAPRGVVLAALALWAVAFLPRPAESAAQVALGWGNRRPWEDPGARGIRISGREASYFEPIVGWIRANVPPDEPIYVGIERHDLPVIGNLRFHVLSDRLPAHKHHEIHPGITDDARVQRETIAALEEHGVRCAVIWRFGGDNPVWSPDRLEPRRDMRRTLNPNWGSNELDTYLHEHYHPVLRIDEYTLLVRNHD